jgi:hypothetical protein
MSGHAMPDYLLLAPEPGRAKWYYRRDIRTYRELLAILA